MAPPSVLLALSLCALWGGTIPSIKISVQGVPPIAVAAWRFLIAVVCLLSLCALTRTSWRLPRKFHKALIPFSLIFVAQISFMNLGTRLTSSSHSVVILHTFPLFVALLAHFFIPNDRLNGWKIVGLLFAFAGICVVFFEPSNTVEPGKAFLGNLLVLVCGFLFAAVLVYSKFLVRDLSAFQITIWEMIYGVPLFFLLSSYLEWNITWRLTTAVVVAGFCFVTWIHLMKRFAASKLNAFQFTTPVFGVILSWLILGEAVSSRLVMGVVLVAAGIYLVSKRPRTKLR